MADALPGIVYAHVGNLYTSFTKGGKRCLRWGSKTGSRAPLEHVVQLVAPGERMWKWAHVFLVSLSPEVHAKWNKQPKNYFVVAIAAPQVESYLQKRYVAIASQYLGTAQYALTTAQKKVSTRPARGPARLGRKAKRVAEGNLKIRSFGNKQYWTVTVADELKYAAKAFKRSDAVSYAVRKACNSIAGMMRKRCGDILNPALATPCPELAKIKRGVA